MPPACWELCPSTAGITTKLIYPRTGHHIGVGRGDSVWVCLSEGWPENKWRQSNFCLVPDGSPRLSVHELPDAAHMLALGPQDNILVSGPQDSAVGLDHGRCQIRPHGTHLHRAVASSKYVTYAIVPEGWEQRTPVHVRMCPCDTVSTVGEEAAGRAFSEGDGKYRSHRPALAG